MFNITKRSIEWGGRTLTLETGKIARQADGAVLATYGGTIVLCTAVAQREVREGQDFFPLTVNYQEKTFAAGKIPGGFFKREGRPAEKEVLTSRLIDRPIRPLFVDGFKNETQVICTVLSHDLENDPDIVAMVGASAALTISGIPFMGPIGGARVGYMDGKFILNPTQDQIKYDEELKQPVSELDLVVAGTARSVLMVESEAKELPEETMLEAVMFGHREMQPVINMIIDLAEASAKEPWEMKPVTYADGLEAKVKELAEADLRKAYGIQSKQDRVEAVNTAKKAVKESLVEQEYPEGEISELLKKLEKDIVRGQILDTGARIDGRDGKTVRPIAGEVNILPRTHGSALFTRGETQALVVATLGTSMDEQLIDALEGEYREAFMLHYNFPPYSVGEASFLKSPGRREIGHGKLAWRALRALVPTKEQFPYTLRVVSEVTESNGSSSMATVCGTSMALMAAGVPMPRAVAGIAMGLIKEGDKFAVLSDIMGDEDHLGDMDFKVAGSDKGITALQMDIKIDGITEEIMQVALTQAKEGRTHILGEMAKAIDTAAEDVNDYAPRITTITIPTDKIREVIGTGGSVIRDICEKSGAKVDIENDGTINIAAVNAEQGEEALRRIKEIVAEPEVMAIYEGPVVRITDFGAFVNFMGARDGLVHISEIANERIEKVDDVLKEGQVVKVKVLNIDGQGKVRLSMKYVNQETGEDLAPDQNPDDFKRDRRPPKRDNNRDRRAS